MGHKLSRPKSVHSSSSNKRQSSSRRRSYSEKSTVLLEQRSLPLTPTINLQIADTPKSSAAAAGAAGADSLDTAEVRQIIIKIQLAKMENGNEQQQQQQQPGNSDVSLSDELNANERQQQQQQIVVERTAGSSAEASNRRCMDEESIMNNNNLAGTAVAAVTSAAAVSTLQLNDVDCDASEMSLLRRRRSSSVDGVEYCEVLETPLAFNEMLSNSTQRAQAASSSESNSCCRSRNSKSSTTMTTANTTAATSKRRCCKCKCRDAFRGLRGMLESSKQSSSNSSSKEAICNTESSMAAVAATRKSRTVAEQHRRSTPATLSVAASSSGHSGAMRQRKRNSLAVPEVAANQLSIWAPASGRGMSDVIIRISSVDSGSNNNAGCSACASPLVTVERLNDAAAIGPAIRLVSAANEAATTTTTAQTATTTATTTASTAVTALQPIAQQQQQQQPPAALRPQRMYGNGITVHSQIDFMHCLVPDLERIINSSFYWGKMDRYEAERLLEGKPEGTFLLRDSAQEEFLFSVTFRKYARSLHARIEQSGHQFSFDCHDPCVFTAPTVTGLLEHYKDPSCVMFFEPCLTIPLHRRQTFTLQQLSRATIVSNTSYDGINQLELPGRLKQYLKEYHYKQKLRAKLCDNHTPYYANM